MKSAQPVNLIFADRGVLSRVGCSNSQTLGLVLKTGQPSRLDAARGGGGTFTELRTPAGWWTDSVDSSVGAGGVCDVGGG